ncbi:MAG: hypothetical protein ACYT04_99970, partial [Nostoc sp.]
ILNKNLRTLFFSFLDVLDNLTVSCGKPLRVCVFKENITIYLELLYVVNKYIANNGLSIT